MTSRWKKVWADFWGEKSRTILTVMIIAVATFGVGADNNLRLYMSESLESDFLSGRPSEATIYAASPLDDEMVKIARAVPGVDAVEGRSTVSASVIPPEGKPVAAQFTALEDPNDLTLNILKPVKGETKLPQLGERQILTDSTAAVLGYKPGDTITVELSNGKRRQLTLAGYVHDITSFPYGGLYGNTIYAYVTPETMEWLGGSRFYNVLAVSVAENQTDQVYVTGVAQAISDRLEKAGATVHSIYVAQPGRHFSWTIVQGIFLLIGALGYMMAFLSGFLIINTITALMARHTRQIGVMKSIGARTSQIFGMYVVLILLIGLVALAIAVPLANAAAEYIGVGMSENLNFHTLPYKTYPGSVIQQIIVALVIPLLAVILPIYSSVRVTIRQALTDYGIGASAKPKDRSVGKGALLIPRPMRLSLRNAFRRKTRLVMTLFVLVLGGSIFIGIYNTRAAFDQTILAIQGYYLADVNIAFERDFRYERVAEIALGTPGVTSVEGWLDYAGLLVTGEKEAGRRVSFLAPPSTSTLIDPVIAAGRWLMPGDQNAVVAGNKFLESFPDLKVGDWLTIKINGRETKWQIVGIYSSIADFGLYANSEHLSKVIGNPDQASTLRVITDRHDPATQSRLADELRARYKASGVQVTSTQTAAEFRVGIRGITDIVIYFMGVMAILIALVGGLGLMSTMSINVLERTREIGVMRAIGASNGDIQGIVIVEGMVIGLISWLISILVSIPITGVLTIGVGMAIFQSPMAPVFTTDAMIIWLVFTVVLTLVSSALPARGASRLTIKDILAYE